MLCKVRFQNLKHRNFKMHLRIRLYDEPILRQKGEKITEFDAELKKLTDDMVETMYAIDASGLAAQQVGHALQVFVLDVLDSSKRLGDELKATLDGKEISLELIMPFVAINPELFALSSFDVVYEEGCMSFPGNIFLPISRPERVYLKYQDIQGNHHELKCGGIFARCILHEFDHLQGILFIDRVKKAVLMRFESKLKQLKRATRDFIKGETKQHS